MVWCVPRTRKRRSVLCKQWNGNQAKAKTKIRVEMRAETKNGSKRVPTQGWEWGSRKKSWQVPIERWEWGAVREEVFVSTDTRMGIEGGSGKKSWRVPTQGWEWESGES